MNTIENASSEKMLKFKLACKDMTFTDSQIELLTLDFEVASVEDVSELFIRWDRI